MIMTFDYPDIFVIFSHYYFDINNAQINLKLQHPLPPWATHMLSVRAEWGILNLAWPGWGI